MSSHILIKRGQVEVETLRRYGRLPAGTRAAGRFSLSQDRVDKWYRLEVRIPMGREAREVRPAVHFEWTDEDERDAGRTVRGCIFRGVDTEYRVKDLFEYALKELTFLLEEMNTSRGNQRFRVVRAEWHPGRPARRPRKRETKGDVPGPAPRNRRRGKGGISFNSRD